MRTAQVPMDDLIAFLRDRIAEDEAVARAAAEAAQTSVWIDGAEGSVLGVGSRMHIRGAVLSIDDIGPHIARWDPARVLALTAVLREAVDNFHWEARETWMLQVIGEALYGSHPEWRAEWRA